MSKSSRENMHITGMIVDEQGDKQEIFQNVQDESSKNVMGWREEIKRATADSKFLCSSTALGMRTG